MAQSDPEPTGYLMAEKQPFSQSLLWDLQAHYFAEKGVDAWRQGEVPHYVTSNPTLANSYAEIVFALWRDQQRLGAPDKPGDEPLYLCELGAGSGRFGFHMLRRLTRLCEQAGVEPHAFCYVLTDVAEANLAFWNGHPHLQPYFADGRLDLARFDVNQSTQLRLQRSRRTIRAGNLRRPLVLIANYVFDSIPQDLFYIDAHRCSQGLVSLSTAADPTTLSSDQVLDQVRYTFDFEELTEAPYAEPYLQDCLADYQRTLSDTHLLFPAAALRCLHRLRALSKTGLCMLSADKGQHRLSALQGQPPPRLISHGSFSMSVNYHAFRTFCENSGGLALLPSQHHHHLIVSSLLLLQEASRYTETRAAYQRHVQEFGPDEFFSISRHARQHIPDMSARDILAYMRFSFYDAHLLAFYLPRLRTLVPDLDANERDALRDMVEQVWDMYFPIGEARDLASDIACLLYALDDYPRALTYFERSMEIYGDHAGTLYHMALCHQMLGQHEPAEALLRTVLKHDPEHRQARALLENGTAEAPAAPAMRPAARPSASQPAASLPPPAYGIDFVDRAQAGATPR